MNYMINYMEIINTILDTIERLHMSNELKPYMKVYADKEIIPTLFNSIGGKYSDDNPATLIFKYKSAYQTDIEFVGIDSDLMNGNLIYFVDGE